MASFFQNVYGLVRQVPTGRVTTYGQVAALLGDPRAAHAVGFALRALPRGSRVPWHRVVNSQGRISLRHPLGGEGHQRRLLEAEGVAFCEDGSIDLRRFLWDGVAKAPERQTHSQRR
jgi:methylated-DNA-protein-cysteine methyltransferase-like protein